MKIYPANGYVLLKIKKVEEKKSVIYSGKEEPRVKYIVVLPEKFTVDYYKGEAGLLKIESGYSVLFEKDKGHQNGDFILVKKEHIIGVVEEDK